MAERAYEFEHRDLHWGNILVSNCDRSELKYQLDDKELKVDSCGIKLTIIDFTFSRMTLNTVCVFNDLSEDPDLFEASGDYQFEIYR